MSDFDKEAEREKLREKYERDKADREATQRMSDLLLKGATMTNTHCNTCGDPLFRQNGTTFCPSCHGGPEGVEGTGLEADSETEPADEEASTEGPAASDAAADDDSTENTPAVPSGETADREERSRARPPTAPSRDHERRVESAPSPESASELPGDGLSVTGPSDAPGDLEGARASLVRALERFARAAAETDDPRYARECLEAAREAAAALATLER
ncbi:Sjogren's syndrome/scleroderma autoantigen 1 family protein [Natrononativus amylolyticus]|uniref:Sjogren's syndrome/scleroderma autoantigen 1 family protein n=1 Tax=Natrononativus amylolyticus TaxID=2963434 RepID=UPI0020CDB190|nr:Sjogren's syndrome/scleroderma autoantigen 1 family protein [Natrononativus amylolyticus]